MQAEHSEPLAGDYEARFQALLDYAIGVGALFDQLLIDLGENVALHRDNLPDAVLQELLTLSRLQFDATCHDLGHPWFAHAAPTHLRPVIEGMALIAFVLGHETDHPVGTNKQRAACLALARAREDYQAMSGANPNVVPVGKVAEGFKRMQFYEELHKQVGCAYVEDPHAWRCRKADGSPCDHRSTWPCRQARAAPRMLTSPTVKLLSKRLSFNFREVEQASSLVLHLMLWDRMLVDAGGGTNEFTGATYTSRAATLAMALSAVGECIVWVMDTINVPAAHLLSDYIKAMWSKPDMVEIETGAWDRATT